MKNLLKIKYGTIGYAFITTDELGNVKADDKGKAIMSAIDDLWTDKVIERQDGVIEKQLMNGATFLLNGQNQWIAI